MFNRLSVLSLGNGNIKCHMGKLPSLRHGQMFSVDRLYQRILDEVSRFEKSFKLFSVIILRCLAVLCNIFSPDLCFKGS